MPIKELAFIKESNWIQIVPGKGFICLSACVWTDGALDRRQMAAK
jgi:hypothetical protein